MFPDRTEAMLFRPGAVPVLVLVLSLTSHVVCSKYKYSDAAVICIETDLDLLDIHCSS